jgi:hypothetical protein
MALSGNSNLLRKSRISNIDVYILFCKFILVGSSHYHHSPVRHNSSIPEGPDLQAISRLAASSQSLHAILSLTSPDISTSYPNLEESPNKTPSVSDIPPSIYKTPTTYASLFQLNNLCSYGSVSMSKTSAPDDGINKSSDEYTDTTTVPSEIHSNEKHLPIEIRVRCIFLRVGEIDTLNERYTSEIFFEASWYAKDPKNEAKYDPQAGHFNPQLVVLNHMGDSLRHDVSIRNRNEKNFNSDF